MSYRIGKNQNLDYLCELTSAATGYEINFDRMLEIGSNIYNMLRAVAVREGCIGDDDNLLIVLNMKLYILIMD